MSDQEKRNTWDDPQVVASILNLLGAEINYRAVILSFIATILFVAATIYAPIINSIVEPFSKIYESNARESDREQNSGRNNIGDTKLGEENTRTSPRLLSDYERDAGFSDPLGIDDHTPHSAKQDNLPIGSGPQWAFTPKSAIELRLISNSIQNYTIASRDEYWRILSGLRLHGITRSSVITTICAKSSLGSYRLHNEPPILKICFATALKRDVEQAFRCAWPPGEADARARCRPY